MFYQADQAIDDLTNMIAYDDVFLKHIVRDYLSVDGLEKISERFIAPVNTIDKAHQTEYLRTIQACYQNHRNITQAANALFIHRNTLLHRLSKIEDILNSSFEVAEDNLQ